MAYSNSSLAKAAYLSPNHSGTRTHSIDRITPHCVVGQLSGAGLGGCFRSKSRQASCNYGIGTAGDIVLIVEEKNRSWCSSSNANDQRAVTIECASDTKNPYAMNTNVWNSLVKLCVDICNRNGKKKLIWFWGKTKSLNYNPAPTEMVLTVHRWFANKACPGDWLYSRLGTLATEVTRQLGGGSATPATPSKPSNPASKKGKTTPQWVGEVTASTLNVRMGPGVSYSNLANYPQLGITNRVDVCDTAKASDGGTWYYVRIAAKYYGWVNAAYIKKAGSSAAKPAASSGYKTWVGKVTANRLNVRTGPGTGYSNLASYPKLGYSNLVDVIGTAKAKDGSTWYKIRIAGKHVGYVHSAYLSRA